MPRRRMSLGQIQIGFPPECRFESRKLVVWPGPRLCVPADFREALGNAALARGGRITTLKGGVPVIVEGQIVGAIGVGRGTEQDTMVAKASAGPDR